MTNSSRSGLISSLIALTFLTGLTICFAPLSQSAPPDTPAKRSPLLTALQAELQDKALFAFDVDKVRSLKLSGWRNVVAGGQTLDLERKSASSWVAKPPQVLDIEPAITESFLRMLSGLRTTKFLKGPPKPEYGLDPAKNLALLTIEIMVEGEKAPLKLTVGGPDAANKAYYAIVGDSKDQVVLVPEDAFKRVLERPVYFTKAGQ